MRYVANGIHMAKDEVSAEFLARRERLLEIHARAFFQCATLRAEGSLDDRFAGKIRGEPAIVEIDDCQAAAVYGNAVRYRKRRRDRRSVNRDAPAVRLEVQRFDSPLVLDNSGEHLIAAILESECTVFRTPGRKHETLSHRMARENAEVHDESMRFARAGGD
jgi:hypothetical protein